MGNFLSLDGALVHYVAAGNGPSVVMIHGAGSLIEDFVLSIMPAAAERWRVYAFDRPGMGYSTRPSAYTWTPRRQAVLLLRAMRRLGVRQPILVAHSWGTIVALAMAIEEPEAIGGLVLLSGYYYHQPGLREMALRMLGSPVAPLAARVFGPLALRVAGRWLARKNFAPEAVPPAFSAGFPAELLARPAHVEAASRDLAALTSSTLHMAPQYPFIRHPVAVLAGAADQIVETRVQSMRLAADLPNASLHLLAGAGHMIHHVRRDAVLAAIDDVHHRMHLRGAARAPTGFLRHLSGL
jgi:pimeloyl-ACP methyl ester carboxylesterase